jgi:hypothetical protein
MNRKKLLVFVLAVAGLLALGAAPSQAAISQAATAGFGGPQWLSTSLPRQARGNGITETVGEVVLSITNPGGAAIIDGSSIDILFGADITNDPDTLNVNVVCTSGAVVPCPASMSVLVVGDNILRISFSDADANAATGTVFSALGDTLTIAGVRVNASDILTDGAQITTVMSGVSSAPATNPITFTDPVRTVATLVNPELDVDFTNAVLNIATCNPGNPDILEVEITENYPGALATELQEEGFSGVAEADNGTQVIVIVSGVPAGVTVDPADVVVSGALTLTEVDGGDDVTSTGSPITFTYEVTSSDTSIVEDATITIALTDIGIVGSPQIVHIEVKIGPIENDDIVDFIDNTQDEDDVAVISDCVTRMLAPWILAGGSTGYESGIVINNTTEDNVAFGDDDDNLLSAVPQDGTCQLTGYPAAGGANVAATTANIPAGQTAAFLASGLTGWSGFAGYVLTVCNFTNAHGFVFLANGFGTLTGPTLAEGYLAMVIPAGSRAVVPPTLTEILGF